MALQDDLLKNRYDVLNRQQGRMGTDALTGAANTEDKNRVRLIDALIQTLSNPGYGQAIDTAGKAQFDAAAQEIERQKNEASGIITTGAAANGVAGGSRAAAAQGRTSAAAGQARTDAATQVTDWRTRATQGHEDILRSELDRILAPTQAMGGAQQAAISGEAEQNRMNTLGEQTAGQYRGALASALAGVVQNGISPAVTAGFTRADRLNNKEFQTYQTDTARYGAGLGKDPGVWSGGNRTWSLWGD